jgi:tetrahydromethanopterin S-methyltransferase subunit F
MWRQLRARGVPKEVVRAAQKTMFVKFISVVARPHTLEEQEAAIQAIKEDMKQSAQLIGKDSAFVDGVFYTRV